MYNNDFNNCRIYVPIEHKCLLTIKEAAKYSNIGENKLSELVLKPNCPFALFNGSKKLIKRVAFEEFLANAVSL